MEDLIIIHGAIGAKEQMIPLGKVLENSFNVHYLELDGHGSKSASQGPFTMDGFVGQLRSFIDELGVSKTHIFGYSMGGFVALITASKGESRISSIFTLGTKLHWDESVAVNEVRHLDPSKIKEKVPRFAEALAARHGSAHWEDVLSRTSDLLRELGKDQPITEGAMSNVHCPVHLCLASEDQMVTVEETERVKEFLPNSEFSRLENSKHPIEQVDLNLLSQKIITFCTH